MHQILASKRQNPLYHFAIAQARPIRSGIPSKLLFVAPSTLTGLHEPPPPPLCGHRRHRLADLELSRTPGRAPPLAPGARREAVVRLLHALPWRPVPFPEV